MAILEFAITLPLFLLIAVGVIETGRMIMVQTLLNDAARQSARMASLDGAEAKGVVELASQRLKSLGVASPSLKATLEPSNLSAVKTGEYISVRISVPFDDVSWLPAPWFVRDTTLSTLSTWRRE